MTRAVPNGGLGLGFAVFDSQMHLNGRPSRIAAYLSQFDLAFQFPESIRIVSFWHPLRLDQCDGIPRGFAVLAPKRDATFACFPTPQDPQDRILPVRAVMC